MLNYPEYFSHLKKLVSYNSVQTSPSKGMPFGKEVFGCLTEFLDIAKKMGFETVNYDGFAGEVSFGVGKEIGIIGHLDIVPAGEGWTTNPFELIEKEGFIYGRGVNDDKGPMLLCLHALKALKESGQAVNKRFRLIVGCNEETGWKDVEYLQKVTALPEYGFSPDGDFPVSYAEKGVLVLEFRLPKLKGFSQVSGGTVINAVCAKASCKPSLAVDKAPLDKHGLTLENGKIVSLGVAAHGSSPELGVNALKGLFEYLLECGEEVGNLLDCLFYDKYGVSKLSNEQGKVTLSPDLIREEGEELVISCDCRIPAPLTVKEVLGVVDKFNIPYTAVEKHPPVMVEKEGWFVNALTDAYNGVTGGKTPPKSMGGSTFARAFSKGVAFGPEFPDTNGYIHQADERVLKANLLRCYEIYERAIFSLGV